MPRKKQTQSVNDEIKGYKPDRVNKRVENRAANLELRKKFKEAELRNNLRLEYDRLAGESILIPKLKAMHGDRYAENASKVINRDLNKLKQLYKESLYPVKHAIQRNK